LNAIGAIEEDYLKEVMLRVDTFEQFLKPLLWNPMVAPCVHACFFGDKMETRMSLLDTWICEAFLKQKPSFLYVPTRKPQQQFAASSYPSYPSPVIVLHAVMQYLFCLQVGFELQSRAWPVVRPGRTDSIHVWMRTSQVTPFSTNFGDRLSQI